MGKLIEAIRNGKRQNPAAGAGTGHAVHTADYLYKKHLSDQGLGAAPTEETTTGPTTTPAQPSGGMTDMTDTPSNFGEAMHNVIARKKKNETGLSI